MPRTKATKVGLAKKLGIARSTLYYRPKRPPLDLELKKKVESVMAEHPACGSRRVALRLGMNRKPVARVMRAFGLKPRVRRGIRFVKPDDLGKPDTRIPNVLATLCPLRPNVAWAGDFAYLWFEGRFWCLATVIDVRTREIIGWHVAKHHTTALVTEAFGDAIRRTKTAPTWFHSDQGSEYLAGAYESLLALHGTKPSQSRKSSPWQNGFQESFYSNFKLELGDIKRFAHVGELIEAIAQQIAYYNTKRIHSAIKMPPVRFRETQKQTTTAIAVTYRAYSLTG